MPVRASFPELGDGRVDLGDDPLHAEDNAEDTLTTAQQVEQLLAGMGQDALVVSNDQAGTGYPVARGPKALDGLAGVPQGHPRVKQLLDDLQLQQVSVGIESSVYRCRGRR